MPIQLPILLGAALVDSINPCAFGVLIFLLSYLLKKSRKPTQLLTHGFSYIAGVFITYLLAGLLLLPLIGSLGSFSTIFYVVLGVLVVIAGLLELKDFFWYGRGFSLELLPGASKRIKLYVDRISDGLVPAFFLGVFVALVELPCTGAVYLAVLSLMSLAGVTGSSFGLLVLYNFVFVLPLLVIIFLMYRGMSADVFETWRKKNRKYMRLAIGLLLVALGAWMIFFRIS
jgi:cytochrome c biogenesis protein CcdA